MCQPVLVNINAYTIGGNSMDLEVLIQLWPIALAFVSLVIVLAKMYNRIDTLEEKVRTLFDLYNKER